MVFRGFFLSFCLLSFHAFAATGYTLTNTFRIASFSYPVCITSPPGETNRLFVVEKNAGIAVITNLSIPVVTGFMALTNVISAHTSDEQGLLGLVFHPGFASNGYFLCFLHRHCHNRGRNRTPRHLVQVSSIKLRSEP